MWHHGDNGSNGMSVVGGAWRRGTDIHDHQGEIEEKETELVLPRMSQDREWRTVPTLFVLLTNRRKLTFGRLCSGVIVKKSAQHENPSLSLRISFFICPFYVNVCVRRAVPCSQVSSLNTRPQSLIYLSFWGYFLFFM